MFAKIFLLVFDILLIIRVVPRWLSFFRGIYQRVRAPAAFFVNNRIFVSAETRARKTRAVNQFITRHREKKNSFPMTPALPIALTWGRRDASYGTCVKCSTCIFDRKMKRRKSYPNIAAAFKLKVFARLPGAKAAKIVVGRGRGCARAPKWGAPPTALRRAGTPSRLEPDLSRCISALYANFLQL